MTTLEKPLLQLSALWFPVRWTPPKDRPAWRLFSKVVSPRLAPLASIGMCNHSSGKRNPFRALHSATFREQDVEILLPEVQGVKHLQTTGSIESFSTLTNMPCWPGLKKHADENSHPDEKNYGINPDRKLSPKSLLSKATAS